ncbi:MAG: hypothetical protein ACRDQ5_13505 [Sciscionella sp.]
MHVGEAGMTLATDLRTAVMLGAARTVVCGLAATGDHGANLLGVRPRRDPYPRYEQLREHGELYRSRMGVYLTVSHALSNSMLRDSRFGVVSADKLSSVDWAAGATDPETLAHPIEHSLLALDPPEHTRLRRIATPWFTPRALRTRVDDVQRVCPAASTRSSAGGSGSM